ncbi:MAG: ABC transporter ATP-binding protein [Candidatus Nitrosocaldus sp.]|nr:ABC transporter ATP-binding protein [Candidatus Nitrosocaldus sp.]MDW8275191.1 ABC transporter ATP-binding protein [Candidatus Nitrosocaldus sp.]
MTRLEVSDLKAYYFTSRGVVKAVDGVTFRASESIGIAGESGSGKSTLGLSIMRMLQPPGRVVSGSIVLDGMDILAMSEHEFNTRVRWKRVSMVFQAAMNALDPVYRVEEQMEELLRYHAYGAGDARELMSSAVRQVGLDEGVLRRYPHELSGGMKQRVVIAMALLLRPSLLIADEPTTALDVLVQAQIINMLKGLKDAGLMLMLITHDLSIIAEIADRIGIMYAGQMVEFGSTDQVYREPKHPYTQALLASIPRMKGEKRLTYIKGSPIDLLNIPRGCRFYARCPYAMDVCRDDPPAVDVGDGYVRCWLYAKH